MLSRICTECDKEFPLDKDHFRPNKASLLGFQRRCNACTNAYARRWMKRRYKVDRNFRERVKRTVRKWRKAHPSLKRRGDSKRRALAKQFIRTYLLSHPCVDCGESDPVVLDFDHRNPKEKRYCIGAGMVSGILPESLIKEMVKCDIRCSNCHRKKHARERA